MSAPYCITQHNRKQGKMTNKNFSNSTELGRENVPLLKCCGDAMWRTEQNAAVAQDFSPLATVFSQHEFSITLSFLPCLTLLRHVGPIVPQLWSLTLPAVCLFCVTWWGFDVTLPAGNIMWRVDRCVCLLCISVYEVYYLFVRHVFLTRVQMCVSMWTCECVTLCFLRSASPAAQVTLRPRPAMPLAPLSPMSFLPLPAPANPVMVQTTWLCVCHAHITPPPQTLPSHLQLPLCLHVCVDAFVTSHQPFYRTGVCLWRVCVCVFVWWWIQCSDDATCL